ncbi:MAG: ATP synthase F1 subunit delta [Phycisphaerae bacterium]
MADDSKNLETSAIGQVYAQALVNMAQQQDVLTQITDDVRSLQELRSADQRFALFLDAVNIPDDDKIASLKKIFEGQVHPLTLQTLNALARRERLIFLPGFFRAFEAILDRLAGKVEVQLTTAQPMAPERVERITAAIAASLGKQPVLKVTVDPTLIGGLRLRIGDTLIDGSVETQLEKLNTQLRHHGVAELQKKVAQIALT